jgi:hypothetical protein
MVASGALDSGTLPEGTCGGLKMSERSRTMSEYPEARVSSSHRARGQRGSPGRPSPSATGASCALGTPLTTIDMPVFDVSLAVVRLPVTFGHATGGTRGRFCHMRLLSWMQGHPKCVRQGEVSALYRRPVRGMQQVQFLQRARSVPDRGLQALACRSNPRLSSRIRAGPTHFAPMWVNAHGQPCDTPDRYVTPSYSSCRLEKPPIYETH